MAKLCSVYSTLLLLSISGALMMVMVAGDDDTNRCKEQIGACQIDCASKCSQKHQGGEGSCSGQPQMCWCFYDCTPANTCEVTLGGPVGGCNANQCNLDCGAKYAAKGTIGYCYSFGDPIFDQCRCRYFC